MTVTTPRAWIIGADRLGTGKLRRPPGSDPERLPDALVRRRIPMKPLKRDQKPIRLPNAGAIGSRQGRARSGFKGDTLGRRQRRRELTQQSIDFIGDRHRRRLPIVRR
jgi:hypothetical protein